VRDAACPISTRGRGGGGLLRFTEALRALQNRGCRASSCAPSARFCASCRCTRVRPARAPRAEPPTLPTRPGTNRTRLVPSPVLIGHAPPPGGAQTLINYGVLMEDWGGNAEACPAPPTLSEESDLCVLDYRPDRLVVSPSRTGVLHGTQALSHEVRVGVSTPLGTSGCFCFGLCLVNEAC